MTAMLGSPEFRILGRDHHPVHRVHMMDYELSQPYVIYVSNSSAVAMGSDDVVDSGTHSGLDWNGDNFHPWIREQTPSLSSLRLQPRLTSPVAYYLLG